jgi:hypothetical protein
LKTFNGVHGLSEVQDMVDRPYAHRVNRVTISGDCFSGGEQWSTGFYYGLVDGDAGDPAGTAEDIAGHWTTFFTSVTVDVSEFYRTLEVKVAQFEESGNTDTEMIDYYTYPAPIVGGGGQLAHPPQCALVATMTSDVQRGLGAKGRMFLPGVRQAIQSNGKISSTDANNVATAFKTFLDAVNADADIPGSVILASHGHRTVLAPGGDIVYLQPVNTLVTGCRVGDVYDTQRKRRNELPEVYTTKVLA